MQKKKRIDVSQTLINSYILFKKIDNSIFQTQKSKLPLHSSQKRGAIISAEIIPNEPRTGNAV